MGRYYSGDIEGKCWFGIQDSDAADRFGVTGTTPEYLEYHFQGFKHEKGCEYWGFDVNELIKLSKDYNIILVTIKAGILEAFKKLLKETESEDEKHIALIAIERIGKLNRIPESKSAKRFDFTKTFDVWEDKYIIPCCEFLDWYQAQRQIEVDEKFVKNFQSILADLELGYKIGRQIYKTGTCEFQVEL